MPAWSPLNVTGTDGTSGRALDHRGDDELRRAGRNAGSSDGAGSPRAGATTAVEARTGRPGRTHSPPAGTTAAAGVSGTATPLAGGCNRVQDHVMGATEAGDELGWALRPVQGAAESASEAL